MPRALQGRVRRERFGGKDYRFVRGQDRRIRGEVVISYNPRTVIRRAVEREVEDEIDELISYFRYRARIFADYVTDGLFTPIFAIFTAFRSGQPGLAIRLAAELVADRVGLELGISRTALNDLVQDETRSQEIRRTLNSFITSVDRQSRQDLLSRLRTSSPVITGRLRRGYAISVLRQGTYDINLKVSGIWYWPYVRGGALIRAHSEMIHDWAQSNFPRLMAIAIRRHIRS